MVKKPAKRRVTSRANIKVVAPKTKTEAKRMIRTAERMLKVSGVKA